MFLFYMFEHLEITFKHNCLYFHMKIGLFHLFTLGITRKLFKKNARKKQHKRTPKSRCVINILYIVYKCMHASSIYTSVFSIFRNFQSKGEKLGWKKFAKFAKISNIAHIV